MRTTGVLLAAALCASIARPGAPGGADKGHELFNKRCSGCHAIDATKAGPPLRGVYGRSAAADPHFPYSDALRKAHVVWNGEALDLWLADPDKFVPGNDMSFRLDSAGERSAIVAYLKQLAAPEKRRE
jgi:cytochrome c